MRLIDADKLKASVPKTRADIFENCRNCKLLDDWQVKELIDKAQTVDAVKVVRCKECKHRDPEDKGCDCAGHEMLMGGIIPMPDNWFCADGERKVQE